jgi:hypothetical protein
VSPDPRETLEHILLRAARKRRRPWWRGRPAIGGLLATLVITAPAAAAIGGVWSPRTEPAAPMTTVTAATDSTDQVPDCDRGPAYDRGGSTSVEPPEDLLRRFGVLRTPQSAEDRAGLASSAIRLKVLPGKVARNYVRNLGTDAAGRQRWLVPTLVSSTPRAGCAEARVPERWFLATIGEGGAGSSDYRDIIGRATVGASGVPDSPNLAIAEGLAPDGVVSATTSYPGGSGSEDSRTWKVRRNYFSYRVDLSVEQASQARVVWNQAATKRR